MSVDDEGAACGRAPHYQLLFFHVSSHHQIAVAAPPLFAAAALAITHYYLSTNTLFDDLKGSKNP
ncbi:MAG: hypothetical protein WDN06_13625 [Asticcacaulis sp.]